MEGNINFSICDTETETESLSSSSLSILTNQDENSSLINNANVYVYVNDINVLDNVLNCTKGRVINNYFNKFKRLDHFQSPLANLIIEKELDKYINLSDLKISTDRLIYLANCIEKTFSSEKANVYFVPYNKETKALAAGKLWTAYNKFKQKIRKSFSSSSEISETHTRSNLELIEIASKFEFLKTNISPWEKVVDYWIATAKDRLEILNESKDNNIIKYFNEYPALKARKGILLLEKDFEYIFKNTYCDFFSTWQVVNSKLIKIVETKSDQNIGELTGLFLLPYILHNNFGKKRNAEGQPLRLTKAESAELFILQVPNIIDLHARQESTRNRLRAIKTTVQPYVIFVGEKNIHCYVDIDDNLYSIDSPLKAIDSCFKVFHATNLCYPSGAEAIWMFIQKAIYKINTKTDKNYISVNNLISELENI